MLNPSIEKFNCAVKSLLESSGSIEALSTDIVQVVEYLYAITGLDPDDDMNNWSSNHTDKGVAISPVQAAKCSKEVLRTQKFMQGVKSALDEYTEHNEVVRVLYAGSGPYATLLLPILSAYDYPNVKVTIVDIHEENVAAVNGLINELGLDKHIEHIECADATKWQPQTPTQFDILISETMTALLKREPQVFIFAHLYQFLKPNGALIPQEVSLKAWLYDKSGEGVCLGEYFKLDLESVKSISQNDFSPFEKSLCITPECVGKNRFKLTTDIITYGEHILTEGQCSLNIPMSYDVDMDVVRPGESVSFRYHDENYPEFIINFPKLQAPVLKAELSDYDALNTLNMVFIKRFAETVNATKHHGEKHPLSESELHVLQLAADSLNCSTHSFIEKAFISNSLDEFDAWLIEQIESLEQPFDIDVFNKKSMDILSL